MKSTELIASHSLGPFANVEGIVVGAVAWLRLGLEVIGALVIAVGVVIALVMLVRVLLRHNGESFHGVRLTLARYLSLALEFQLGADILSTAVAPSWDQIGKLAAIAVIRTALNYFLMHEMAIEKEEEKADRQGDL